MLDLIMLLAVAAGEPAVPEAREEPPIDVRGSRMICRSVYSSAESRLNRQRVCRSSAEWDEIRDQAAEFLADMPRRNPRSAGRTMANPMDGNW